MSETKVRCSRGGFHERVCALRRQLTIDALRHLSHQKKIGIVNVQKNLRTSHALASSKQLSHSRLETLLSPCAFALLDQPHAVYVFVKAVGSAYRAQIRKVVCTHRRTIDGSRRKRAYQRPRSRTDVGPSHLPARESLQSQKQYRGRQGRSTPYRETQPIAAVGRPVFPACARRNDSRRKFDLQSGLAEELCAPFAGVYVDQLRMRCIRELAPCSPPRRVSIYSGRSSQREGAYPAWRSA